MATTIATTTPLTGERLGDRVAAYRTLQGAALAVDHLRERGPDAGVVAIVPAGIEPAGDPVAETRWRAALAAGLATGAAAAAVAALLVWSEGSLSLGGALALAVAGLVGGAVVGVAMAVLDRRRRSTPDLLRAERFEVVCTDEAPAARHVLARWWDPAAPPVSRRA